MLHSKEKNRARDGTAVNSRFAEWWNFQHAEFTTELPQAPGTCFNELLYSVILWQKNQSANQSAIAGLSLTALIRRWWVVQGSDDTTALSGVATKRVELLLKSTENIQSVKDEYANKWSLRSNVEDAPPPKTHHLQSHNLTSATKIATDCNMPEACTLNRDSTTNSSQWWHAVQTSSYWLLHKVRREPRSETEDSKRPQRWSVQKLLIHTVG